MPSSRILPRSLAWPAPFQGNAGLLAKISSPHTTLPSHAPIILITDTILPNIHIAHIRQRERIIRAPAVLVNGILIVGGGVEIPGVVEGDAAHVFAAAAAAAAAGGQVPRPADHLDGLVPLPRPIHVPATLQIQGVAARHPQGEHVRVAVRRRRYHPRRLVVVRRPVRGVGVDFGVEGADDRFLFCDWGLVRSGNDLSTFNMYYVREAGGSGYIYICREVVRGIKVNNSNSSKSANSPASQEELLQIWNIFTVVSV